MVELSDDEDVEAPQWRSHDIVMLRRSSDAAGRLLQVEQIYSPRKRFWRFKSESFAASYVNAYLANGAVITACFGDVQRDEEALQALARAFPQRAVEMLRIDHVAAGGGGIHCQGGEVRSGCSPLPPRKVQA
jgi:agmatine deiminase